MQLMLFLQEYEFKIFHKPGKHHHGADFLYCSAEVKHETSIKDEPMDVELFQVDYLHDEDPKWMDIRTFLLIGLVPKYLNTSEKKGIHSQNLEVYNY